MKTFSIKNFIVGLMLGLIAVLVAYPMIAHAQVADIPADQFFNQVLNLIKSFGGLSSSMKLSGIILLIIATFKVSFLKPFWDKLGNFKIFAVPALSIIAGIVELPSITLPGIAAYLFMGAGAVFFHEILDALKAIPGLGNIYQIIIDLFSKILFKPQS